MATRNSINSNIAIEFDGKQHFTKDNPFHKNNDDAFNKQKQYDEVKNKYCHNKGIKLIRIPYFNISRISEILTMYL